MDSARSADTRSVKAIKGSAVPSPPANSKQTGPTTFFLKTENELERGATRGRKTSRSSVYTEGVAEGASRTPTASMTQDSSSGVQSLEDTMNPTISASSSLSRTMSISSDQMSDGRGDLSPSEKRKAGNRVHPSILATGQRIISSEKSSSIASPVTPDSSFRNLSVRRGSGMSMNRPLTPIRLSPHPESATPSTPHSGSPKSFHLSDEESIVADDTGSQAIMSSSGDEEPPVERTPQLVMPSLAMPIRRPFTEQGRSIGRAKFLVVGPKGVGKTRFIHSLFRSSEHIVHMDDLPPTIPSQSTLETDSSNYDRTTSITEIQASTRSFPSWWTNFESRRKLHRRLSIGEGVLERNLSFIDTPGLEDDRQIRHVFDYLKDSLSRTSRLDSMSEGELINLLSGDGGVLVDAVFYLFEPTLCQNLDLGLSSAHQELLSYLSRWTNLIPLIGRADTVTPDVLHQRKQQISQWFDSLQTTCYSLNDATVVEASVAPLSISSALDDNSEEVDASVLMSSQYMQPMAPSELGNLVEDLFTPSNIARMRHTSAIKFLQWRQESMSQPQALRIQDVLQSPQLGYDSRVTSNGSLLEDSSKVLVPHSASSYYRSTSSAISDASAISGNTNFGTAGLELARYHEQSQPAEPFRQVRLAKWAQDLQRSLGNERKKYQHMYAGFPTDWSSGDSEKDEQALVRARDACRPSRGRLGGDLGVIDPRDPLGVLALGQVLKRRSFLVLQVVGGCGILGAIAYWVLRFDVRHYLGLGQPVEVASTSAIPPPSSSWMEDNILYNRLLGWRG